MNIIEILRNMAATAEERREEVKPTWKTTVDILNAMPEETFEQLESKFIMLNNYLKNGDDTEKCHAKNVKAALAEKERIGTEAVRYHSTEIINNPHSAFGKEYLQNTLDEPERQ